METTGHLSTTHAGDFLAASQPDMETVFAGLPAPALESLNGVWPGRAMAATGFDWLPGPLRSGFWGAMGIPLLNPWRGKEFHGTTGANHWFRCPGKTFGTFTIEIADAEDSRPVVLLNYDTAANPNWLRPVRGQLRTLGPDRLLGRMSYLMARGDLQRVMFFVLQRS